MSDLLEKIDNNTLVIHIGAHVDELNTLLLEANKRKLEVEGAWLRMPGSESEGRSWKPWMALVIKIKEVLL